MVDMAVSCNGEHKRRSGGEGSAAMKLGRHMNTRPCFGCALCCCCCCSLPFLHLA